jgi:hypothetical protein
MAVADTFRAVGWSDVAREYEQASTIAAAVLTNGQTIFTVSGGPIIIEALISECITTCSAAAATLQWRADGIVGAATPFTGASASLASFAAGGMICVSTASLSAVPSLTAVNGVGVVNASPLGILIPAGVIQTVVTSPTTGTFTTLSPLAADEGGRERSACILSCVV